MGNLYGMTSVSCGTVFQLTPAGGEWTKTTIYDFGMGSDGCEPQGGLVFDASGNLYGATRSGGTDGFGTVFELKPSVGGDWTESVIHSFAGAGSDGAYPLAGLAADAAGNFYGTTVWGGTGNVGSVYELSPSSDGTWTESVLYSFSANVAIPKSKLWVDASGNLFGTASDDGENGPGAAFELTKNSQGAWQQTVLHIFGGKRDGERPFSDLFQDANGSLYGTTYIGGQGGAGTVYKLTPNSGGGWSFETLNSFSGKDGNAPYDGVVYVGANFGTLYALDATSGAQLWSAHLIHYGNSPAVANGVVYVTSNQELYALNARTGAKLWVYKNNPVSDFLVYPAVSNGMLYVGDSSYYQLAFGLK